ncbi:hypothetical protein Acr_02g0005460 [Actinidia rufa]|uniref:Uncharacterized protein n=1 Tax=Actinidia rufa TaxID=165716 RepID=A0A7J0E7Z4_9ERIC|nr:hypothetical protein Acr_02g0005460 [Actinidia rufa]
MLNQQMMEEFAEINDFESLLQRSKCLKRSTRRISLNKKSKIRVQIDPSMFCTTSLLNFQPVTSMRTRGSFGKWWKEVISTSDFITENAFQAKSQALIQQSSTSPKSQYFKVKLMEMDELKIDYKLHEVRVCPMGRVRSSCNGMLLLNHPKRECVLEVANVVTRCYETLPKCPSGCPHKECGCALTFDLSPRRVSGPWKDPWEWPLTILVEQPNFGEWEVSTLCQISTTFIPLGSLRDGEVFAFAHKHSDAFYALRNEAKRDEEVEDANEGCQAIIYLTEKLSSTGTPQMGHETDKYL